MINYAIHTLKNWPNFGTQYQNLATLINTIKQELVWVNPNAILNLRKKMVWTLE